MPVVAGWSLLLAKVSPEALLVVNSLAGSRIFGFFSLEEMPSFELGAGMTLNLSDFTVISIIVIGWLAYRKQQRRPLFSAPLIILFVTLFLSTVTNIDALGSPKGFLNNLRPYVFYFVYFGMLGFIDSERRLKFIIALPIVMAAVAVGIQLLEFINGEIIVLSTDPEYASLTGVGRYIDVAGFKVFYIHNRQTYTTFYALFLALGVLFFASNRVSKKSWFIASVMFLLAFLLAFVRQWWVMIAVGVITLIAVEKRTTSLVRFALLGFAIIMVLALVTRGVTWFDADVGSLVVERALTVGDVPQGREGNFNIRVEAIALQLMSMREKIFFGYGLTPAGIGLLNTDVGLTNTIVRFGLLGLLYPIVFSVLFYRTAFRLKQELPQGSKYRGMVIGLIGLWTAMLGGYAFSQDFFTQGPGIPVSVAILIDCISYLHRNGKLSEFDGGMPKKISYANFYR